MWPAVDARDAFAQHSDPLHALSRGEISAIIIRGAMKGLDLDVAVRRLIYPADATASGSALPPQRLWQRRRGRGVGQLSTIGAELHTYLDRGPAALVEEASRLRRAYELHGIAAPIAALHNTLRALAGERRVATARLDAKNATLGEGVFRMQGSGVHVPQHIDTLRAHRWNTARNCSRSKAAVHEAKVQYAKLARFPDPYRFDEEFSAVLMLQPAAANKSAHGARAADAALFDAHWTDLLRDCSIAGSSHGIGVNILGFGGAASRRGKAFNVSLDAGDLYVFNSNRVHEVLPIKGTQARLTFGAFVGYSASELRVWA